MPDDADVGIVTSAVQIAHTETCCVIGEDTDLLVLLVYYTDLDSRPIYINKFASAPEEWLIEGYNHIQTV